MPAWTDLLIRDSLQDTGVVPSPGYPYTSPDIICTQQTTYPNPQQQFGSAAYTSDPNQPVINSQNNFFYVRGKNLGAQSQGGNMYVYWSKASLLLTPDQWFSQPMSVTIQGKSQNNNPLPPVGQNLISVAAQPFAWTPVPISASDHFCLIGAVGTSQHTWPPATAPTFASWDAFVLWVRNNQNICWRNLSLAANPNTPEWDRVDGLYNKWNYDTPLLIRAACAAVPINTQITLKCTALGINTTQTVTDPNQSIYAPGVTCPASFSGYVETIAQLPQGGRWPSGARITTTAYFGSMGQSPLRQYAESFGADDQHPHVLAAKSLAGGPQASLVAVGNSATAYQPFGMYATTSQR